MKTVFAAAVVAAAAASANAEVVPRSYIATAEGEFCTGVTDRVNTMKRSIDGNNALNREPLARSSQIGATCFVAFQGSETLSREVSAMEGIVALEQNQVVKALQSNPTWGLDRIDQNDLPLDGANFSPSHSGAGYTIYIIDTGVRASHNEFGGRASLAYDATGEGGGDGNGHGTHCAGTAGGATYGVAKGATIKGVKVLTSAGSGTNAGVIDGIEWAASDAGNRAAVLSLSLGGGASTATDNAVNAASNEGNIVTVAAGNDNANACNYSPAGAGGNGPNGGVITVVASDNSDSRASYSSYGSCTDIIAPGSSITSAWINSDSSTNTISGTSMACPHVAGVAAVLLHKNGGSKTSAINEMFDIAVSGTITSVPSATPNVFLQVPNGGSGTTAPPQTTPTSPPNAAPSPTANPTGVWTCPSSWFGTSDGCDCECGGGDPDCDGNFGQLYCNGEPAGDNVVCDFATDTCVSTSMTSEDLLASGRTPNAQFAAKTTEEVANNDLFVGLGIGGAFAALVAFVALVANRQSIKASERAAALSIVNKPDEAL